MPEEVTSRHKPPIAVWTDECQKAFDQIKVALTVTPTLAYPDVNKPFDIYTDACDTAIGGVLQQNGQPIAYFSMKLDSAQRNYMIYEKEALAVVKCVKQWHHLIQNGQPLNVFVDNKGVSCLLKQNFSNPRQARWSSFLQQYGNLRITFIKGSENVVADALSRHFEQDGCTKQMAMDAAVLQANLLNNVEECRVYCLQETKRPQSCYVLDPVQEDDHIEQPILDDLALKETWKSAYINDKNLCAAYKNLVEGISVVGKNKYELSGGILKLEGKIVVPYTMRQNLLAVAHDTALHLGGAKMYHRLRQYYWPGMDLDIRVFCKKCVPCLRAKGSKGRHMGGAGSAYMPPEKPFQRLHFDLVGPIRENPDSETNMLFTCIDAYSKFAWAIPTTVNVTGEEITRLFLTHIMPFSGVPKEIVTDRGPQFIASFFKHLTKALGVGHRLPSPYHPESNGVLERWHRDLGVYLRLAVHSLNKSDWIDGVGIATYAHNTTYHEALGTSPYELCFGEQASHPIDEWAETNVPEEVHSQKATDRTQKILEARARVSRALEHARTKYNRVLNKRRVTKQSPVKPGEWILVNTTRYGSLSAQKLQPKVQGPFRVTEILGNQVVFEIIGKSNMTNKCNMQDCFKYEQNLETDCEPIFEELLKKTETKLKPTKP
ncbi:RNase H-like domain-containing protein, partial [Nitrosomonas sp.]|uniref:RNase H-like domain-containing protein n=1 Tax=Nitrosomonas sp. TaxID=42353 RepID=UPI0025CC2D72